jgi:pimeloyl-ACP methyl ester carboxylesterase
MSATPIANREFAEIQGSTMAYIDIGEGDTVVLAHGYLWSADMWEEQIRTLSRRYRVIAPDLWGHGESGPLPPDTGNLQQIALQHLSLLDHLGIERFAVAGLSVGGMWAVELALLFPHRIAALALLGTHVGSESEDPRKRYFSMLDTAASLASVPDAIIEALVPLFFSASAVRHRTDVVDTFRRRLRQSHPGQLVKTLVPLGRMIFGRRDAVADLPRLAMPSLVISGGRDLFRPPHEGLLLAQALGCRFIEIENAGHILTLDAPERISDLLSSLLAEAFPGSPPTAWAPADRPPGERSRASPWHI